MFTETPADPQDLTNEELTVSPEQMEKIRDIVSRRDQIQELIRKAESRKDKVKPEIYAKVTADYEEKMKAVAAEYEPVAAAVRTDLAAIRGREKLLRASISQNSDTLEELRFRCEVGEFSEEDLKQRETENVKVLEELEKKITVVETTYEECKKYLGEEDFEEAIRDEPEPPGEVIESEDDIIISDGGEEVITIDEAPAPEEEGDIDIPAPAAAFPPPDDPVPGDPGSDIDITLSDVDPATLREADAVPPALEEAPPDTLAGPELAPPVVEEAPPPPPADGDFEATIAFQARCFLKLAKEDGTEETYLLGSDSLSIGRNHKNDVVLLDRSISRKHAQIVPEGPGSYSILDLSSGGGIFVNGEKVKKTTLSNGDQISIGDFQLSFVQEMAV